MGCWWWRTLSDPATFWAMLTVVGTFVLAFVAWKQLSDLARVGPADFVYRLKMDFFSEETRKLIFLLDYDLLEFRKGGIPYFRILRNKTTRHGEPIERSGYNGGFRGHACYG